MFAVSRVRFRLASAAVVTIGRRAMELTSFFSVRGAFSGSGGPGALAGAVNLALRRGWGEHVFAQ
jgi:hypothetical protein